jgi:poly-gamma-glutamate biosynthesis protein PgsC/CapC
MIIFGRRRTVMMILVGYLLGALVRMFFGSLLTDMQSEVVVIGYIIPGLIAIWMDRQGLVETLTALLTASVVVRLLLIIFVGAELST